MLHTAAAFATGSYSIANDNLICIFFERHFRSSTDLANVNFEALIRDIATRDMSDAR